MRRIPSNFYELVESNKEIKYILMSDTDSAFIRVPEIKLDKYDKDTIMKIADVVARVINDHITEFQETYFLPRCGIDPEYNKLYFKTEFVMDALLLLDVKKNYAYRILGEKTVNYKGMPVVKADVPIMVKEIIRYIVEKIMFNRQIPKDQKVVKIQELLDRKRREVTDLCKKYRVGTIGKPVKMTKSESNATHIQGMKRWNKLVGFDQFTLGSSGYLVYVEYTQGTMSKNTYDTLVIPRELESKPDKIKEVLVNAGLRLSPSHIWEHLINVQTIKRLKSLAERWNK